MRRLILGASLLITSIVAQADGFFRINSIPVTEDVPMQLKLKDLDKLWFSFTASSVQRPDAEYQSARLAHSLYGGAGTGVYYSRGRVVKVAETTFLIAYSVTLPEDKWVLTVREQRSDEASIIGGSTAQDAISQERLTPETPLVLSLLNTRSMAAMDSIVPFDMARLLRTNQALLDAEAQKHAENVQQTEDERKTLNLKALALALRNYINDYDEHLPPLENAAAARLALDPYSKDKSIFAPPGSAKPYQPNPQLSHKSETQLNTDAVVFYEAEPAADGKRAVLLINDVIRRVDEVEWKRLKAVSKIP